MRIIIFLLDAIILLTIAWVLYMTYWAGKSSTDDEEEKGGEKKSDE